MLARRLAVPLALLFASLASCSDDAGPASTADSGLVCEQPAQVAYSEPGCGVNAPAPYCQGPTDACITLFCDCDGTTRGGACGFALRPFLHAGPCEGDGGQPDVQSDAPADATDGHSDAPSEAAQSDAPAEAADGHSDAPAEASDAPSDSPADGGDGALVCAIGSTVAYHQAGCGAGAPAPYCQGPTDACAQPFCDCDGTTHIGGCGFALRPFRYAGECVDGGTDGGDGGGD